MIKTIAPQLLTGKITIPPSKSDAQRTFLAAALAEGISHIAGAGKSDDEKAMLQAIQDLGAKVEVRDDLSLLITGIDESKLGTLVSSGESGLGFRLLTAVCASFSQQITVTGNGTLVSRPMDFYDGVLPQFGAKVSSNNGLLPYQVTGPIKGGEATVDGSLSSQFISGMLMALPRSEADSVLNVPDLKSGAYVQMTLNTLKAFGIVVETSGIGVFKVKGKQKYTATTYAIDADWSSASCWLTAAAIGHDIELTGLKMNSLQADKAMLSALLAAGCKINQTEHGIKVDGANLKPFEFDATDCPDLFPALAVLASYCVGTTEITGAERLVHKESHRGLALQKELGTLGIQIDLIGDIMRIHGTGKLSGGKVSSHHDHRLAMCMAIAASKAAGAVQIEGAESVGKSYPEFWDHLELVTN